MATTAALSNTSLEAAYTNTKIRSKSWRLTLGTLTTSETPDTGIDLKAGWVILGVRMTVVQASDKGATTTIALGETGGGTLLAASSVASTVAAGTRYVGKGSLIGVILTSDYNVLATTVVASGPCVADTIVDVEILYTCFDDVA